MKFTTCTNNAATEEQWRHGPESWGYASAGTTGVQHSAVECDVAGNVRLLMGFEYGEPCASGAAACFQLTGYLHHARGLYSDEHLPTEGSGMDPCVASVTGTLCDVDLLRSALDHFSAHSLANLPEHLRVIDRELLAVAQLF